jgi:hypothetical protein
MIDRVRCRDGTLSERASASEARVPSIKDLFHIPNGNQFIDVTENYPGFYAHIWPPLRAVQSQQLFLSFSPPPRPLPFPSLLPPSSQSLLFQGDLL